MEGCRRDANVLIILDPTPPSAQPFCERSCVVHTDVRSPPPVSPSLRVLRTLRMLWHYLFCLKINVLFPQSSRNARATAGANLADFLARVTCLWGVLGASGAGSMYEGQCPPSEEAGVGDRARGAKKSVPWHKAGRSTLSPRCTCLHSPGPAPWKVCMRSPQKRLPKLKLLITPHHHLSGATCSKEPVPGSGSPRMGHGWCHVTRQPAASPRRTGKQVSGVRSPAG